MYDVAIIGAGITGCAIAYELGKYNVKAVIVEKENDVSEGTTKANSAIIHGGYDPKPGTKMAEYNIKGNVYTKELCEKLDVPYKQIGALVVAFSEEEKKTLEELNKEVSQTEFLIWKSGIKKTSKRRTKSFRQSRCGFKFSKCRNRKPMGISPGTCRNSRIKWS